MATGKNARHKKNKRWGEVDFLSTKTGFVAGITLIVTIVKDLVELIVSIPKWCVSLYVFVIVFIWYLVLCTKKLDNYMKERQVANFGFFTTLMSIIIFIIENSIIKFSEVASGFDLIAVVVVGVVIIIASFVVLLARFPENND